MTRLGRCAFVIALAGCRAPPVVTDEARVANVPAATAPVGLLPAVVGESVVVRVAGASVAATRGGAPLALREPSTSTYWVMALPVIEVAADALRLRVEHTDVELWLWIATTTAMPVVRTAQPLARTAREPVAADAGVWLTPGVPIEISGGHAGGWDGIAYPPRDTTAGDDFSLAFTGFVRTGSLGRSFVPDRSAPRFPPWARPMVERGVAATVVRATDVLARPGGAVIARLTPDAQYGVTLLEARGPHRRIAIDTGEVGVVGWITGDVLGTLDDTYGIGGFGYGNLTAVAAGTCLFDAAGQPVGQVPRAVNLPLDSARSLHEPTPWGTVTVYLEPGAGGIGWRICDG